MSVMIQITEAAASALANRLVESCSGKGIIKLIYDTDGCGCAVNGVPALRLIDEPAPFDLAVDTNTGWTWVMDKHQMVFFDEALVLDVSGTTGMFKLSSTQQIYSTHVACEDHRKARAN
ncbi:iron-sulfur cluster biosynthesis family protein [Paenibacillus apiarius]|uniref:Iron-sulfur cluster biosynthesis family protein n=1 Tax=Paenibacillus apiarius TaxID=46240 RepID=A0ABT4DTU6_9BACL|nr:iron-sulfur cluster biosynthesis family protein [Paenibacillus apiarius]MCY9515870.1 iron-sulfur cluster biosynthesis family protein [Paenibacillus apiarius]MCY9520780.1 iron-sulfur cluster biosynthesis family protein [Paenibacillus apiarius]MCY9553484.1 iron-sulfur cluster biosynthesis family protein [Paenibacillus apiarius]MCY9557992.1 iron-sulfur cluster biosynthesis family protein [Paenibacillus apiarius]MCY9685847.1 iron-sulfur cluster biosynthesis family protein [Paenibacillus apiariu